MRKEKYHIYLNADEKILMLHSLVEFKNDLMKQGRYTDCIDDIILKIVSAPIKRVKVI